MIYVVCNAGSGEITDLTVDANAAANWRAAGAAVIPWDNTKFVTVAVIPGNLSAGQPVPKLAGVSAADLPAPVTSATVSSGGKVTSA